MRFWDLFSFQAGPVTFWTSFIYLITTLLLIHIHETVPSAPQDLPAGVNLTEAWQDLQNITNAYHPFNSRENDRVRQFLIDRSLQVLVRNKIDHTVIEQPLTSNRSRHPIPDVVLFNDQASNFTMIYDAGDYLSGNGTGSTWTGQYFEGSNFFIYIRGKDDPKGGWWLSGGPDIDMASTTAPGKGVLVNCHFDSAAISYGATDDGVACVSMLQLLSHFTSAGRQPSNGIILLFNNAEEDGLLGSRAFGRSPLAQLCSTFVNLEGVGAGNRAMLFRATDMRVVRAYSESPHPFGSIVANEGYDRGAVMSGTDYSVFADIYGWHGLDIAFYRPRSRYHTPEDDARHTSVDSVWHMLSAALATTKKLSEGGMHSGDNVETDRGVWFDWLGRVWIVFPLRGLFVWSLTLLILTPLTVVFAGYALVRKGKMAPEVIWDDDLRFPLAFVSATTLTLGPVVAVAIFNPLIIYSSGYAVWAMALSSCYIGFWLPMKRACPQRTRSRTIAWLFALSWVFQVFAAAVEDRHIGSFYFAAFFHCSVFVCLLLSLVDQLTLKDRNHTQEPAHQNSDERSVDVRPDEEERSEVDDDSSSAIVTIRTPLLRNNDGLSEPNSKTHVRRVWRRSMSVAAALTNNIISTSRHALEHEDSRVGGPPASSWLLQLLILAPVHIILVGSQGLTDVSSIAMTGTDGNSDIIPLMVLGFTSIVFLLPLTPFIHRTTHHIPLLLLVAFMMTLIYNLAAFPFSANNRFKFFFQQMLDLDQGDNMVTLTGIEDYLRLIVRSLPDAEGRSIQCHPALGRALVECQYDASRHPPNLASGLNVEDLITVATSWSADGNAARILLDAVGTRNCFLDLSHPIANFTIKGEAARDPRFIENPADGPIQHIQLWRRQWEGAWDVTLFLNDDHAEAFSASIDRNETRGQSDTRIQPLEAMVRCAWSDANDAATIPALSHLQQYMPSWAIPSKRGYSLVEVRRRCHL